MRRRIIGYSGLQNLEHKHRIPCCIKMYCSILVTDVFRHDLYLAVDQNALLRVPLEEGHDLLELPNVV